MDFCLYFAGEMPAYKQLLVGIQGINKITICLFFLCIRPIVCIYASKEGCNQTGKLNDRNKLSTGYSF